jgi:hypothetical protein
MGDDLDSDDDSDDDFEDDSEEDGAMSARLPLARRAPVDRGRGER